MKFLPDLFKKWFIVFVVIFSYPTLSMAYTFIDEVQTAFDGTGNIVFIARTIESSSPFYGICGASNYQPPFTLVLLTDVDRYNTSFPILAVSKTNTATTSAAAIWLASDLVTNNVVVQASILSKSGWKSPVTLSLNDGMEKPRNGGHTVSISNDGTSILVTWPAVLNGAKNPVVLRSAFSSDGGDSWTISTNNYDK